MTHRSCRFNHCSHLPAPPHILQNSSALAAVLPKRYHILRSASPLGKQIKIHLPSLYQENEVDKDCF